MAKAPNKKIRDSEYPKLNPMRKVQKIPNYRGYKLILYLPVVHSKEVGHIGYLDNDFFGYKLKRSSTVDTMTPLQIIDHYLDVFYFKSPEMDYSIFQNDNKYKLEMACLKFIHDTVHKG